MARLRNASAGHLHSRTVKVVGVTFPLTSYPPTPTSFGRAGKVYNPFANQMDEAFIENRRADLQVYLKKLINIPKVRDPKGRYNVWGGTKRWRNWTSDRPSSS